LQPSPRFHRSFNDFGRLEFAAVALAHCVLISIGSTSADRRPTGSERRRAMPESDCIEQSRQSPKIGRYANVFRVGFNAFEVVIEFGEQFSDAENVRMHTRVVTNPVFARGLINSLNDALTNYANEYASETAASPQGRERSELR
jgi:Protein of unknown function (DUF3467)